MPLVDVETTGLAPGRHRIIEVAATIVKNGEMVASFSRLVNPARSIPQFITKFTGISPSMVARASLGRESAAPTSRSLSVTAPLWDTTSASI